MTAHPEFAYVQARLQARHGALPLPLAWQVLEASHTASHYLALARSGPMARWVETLDDAQDPHRVERHLRSQWRAYVEAVASWMPQRWQPALRWFGRLSDLALIDALQRDARDAHWLRRDESLAASCTAASSAALAPDANAGESDIATRWLAEWTRRLPGDAHDAALLRQPAERLLPRLRGPEHARSAADEPTRRALHKLFRRHAATAVAAFAHLALVALDVERLRGGLVMRALFENPPETAAV